MTVPQRVSLVTLGVADVASATAFYGRLGWHPSSQSVEGVVTFFATPGCVVALWGAAELAADAGLRPPDLTGTPSTALALNLGSRAQVDAALSDCVAAGGSVAKAPVETDWGGYSGYVRDPDGNLWELAHNPAWPLDERGLPVLPA